MKKRRTRKKISLFLSLLVIFGGSVLGVLAMLTDKDVPIENIFTPSQVTCEVTETFEENIKSDVKITNTGNTSAYIRAAIVVNWIDEEGNIAPVLPQKNVDYELSLDLANGWFLGADGYYYYSSIVESTVPNNVTNTLIEECKPLKNNDGYTLTVDILASAIQSTPASAVADTWGVTVDTTDKTISK